MYKALIIHKKVEKVRKKWVVITQIAATYIGTVIGAGFATGQEILQFFTIFHNWGLIGILVSTILFVWLGIKMMILSHRIGAYSYQELNNYLFGKTFGTIINLFVFLILFGVTCVMLSGTGAIFKEQLNLPFQLGILITLVLCYIVMLKGLKGIFMVNSMVVPLMIMFSIIIAVKVGWLNHEEIVNDFFKGYLWNQKLQGWKWFLSALTYVAFNLSMAQAVLVPLGKEVQEESTLIWGGFWGGAGLGFMLLASHFALQTLMPNVSQYDIPMAILIKDIGGVVFLLFLLVIYGEIFTTLVGNVFGMSRQIRNLYKLTERWTVVVILLTSYIVSQIGFSTLVSYLYPLFGYMGLLLLLRLGLKRLPPY